MALKVCFRQTPSREGCCQWVQSADPALELRVRAKLLKKSNPTKTDQRWKGGAGGGGESKVIAVNDRSLIDSSKSDVILGSFARVWN
jgi:hypothetical protein